MAARPEAFAQEVAALEPVLLRFALRASRDPERARELVQETFVAALAAPAPFEGRSQLRTWVIGILAHKLVDALRARPTWLVGEEATDDLLQAPSPEDLERAAIARQDLARVSAALGALPARERLAMLLVDVEAVGRPAACEALGVSSENLRVLLHRGRNRLRRSLERDA
jgi:RNA polymerase sigma-70 factor (ECF subfamily)